MKKITAGEWIKVTRPLRLDLAGGWSDTPPICNLVGGCVLNAAVTLDGKEPVVAEVRRIQAREVRVESRDLGKKGVLKKKSEIYGKIDPHDWCALVKSALAVTSYDFSQGGLEIRISADVPKGSGMGTSSILGSALIEALLRQSAGSSSSKTSRHPKVTPETIAQLTLEMERVMQTGGGWEDQVGALYLGVKLIETKKGATQKLKVTRLSPKAEQSFARLIRERGVLYFTGQKRMARNVLRGVLNFYKENPDNLAHEIIAELKKNAKKAFEALEKGKTATFLTCLNHYWLSKKALDPGSTNPGVETIIARIAPWCAAVELTGAGGGGFLFALATSREAKARMQRALTKLAGEGRLYDFRIVV